MFHVIVSSDCPVTLVGSGHVGNEDLTYALRLAPRLVAADGGAGVALAAGLMPEAVIGDLDSLAQADRAALPRDIVHHNGDQDTTDFEKALASISAPAIVAVGFTGARLDHTLAVFSALLAHSSTPCVVLGETELVFHLTGSTILPVAPGDRVSLYPMRPVTGRSTGLRWPIDGLRLAPGGRIATSNEAIGPVQIDVDGPGLLAILPRQRLERLMQQMAPA